MLPIWKFATAMWARTKTMKEDADRSALAEALSRLRFDGPSVSLWSLIKMGLATVVLGVVLYFTAWPFAKWWIRESILADFRIEQQRKEQAQLRKDQEARKALDDELADVRARHNAKLDEEMGKLSDALSTVAALQKTLEKAGSCGWAPETVQIINGTRPKPKAAARVAPLKRIDR